MHKQWMSYKTKVSGPSEQIPPKNPKCENILRLDVVWFGKPLLKKNLEIRL